MVKAKKTKNIHLTLVKKKGAQLKKDVIEKIRQNVDTYDHIYLLSYNKNASTSLLQQMREHWKPEGRFTFAKNSVTAVALGKKPEDEYHQNLHLLSKDVKGNCCVLYTSKSKADLLKYLKISKKNGIDLELLSYWSKSGDYVSHKKAQTKKAKNDENAMEL